MILARGKCRRGAVARRDDLVALVVQAHKGDGNPLADVLRIAGNGGRLLKRQPRKLIEYRRLHCHLAVGHHHRAVHHWTCGWRRVLLLDGHARITATARYQRQAEHHGNK